MGGFRLTGRGLAVLIAGVALCASAWWFREPPLLWPGVFCVLLPLLSLLTLALGTPSLSARWRLVPDEVEAGDTLDIGVEVHQRRPALAGVVDAVNVLPGPVGGDHSFVLPLPGAGRDATERYRRRPSRRGRYDLGLLSHTDLDALGLARRSHRIQAPAPLVVLPRVLPLGAPRSGTDDRFGEAPVARLAVSGADDALVREYRPRDDVRRIHWPSTARTSQFMVRREEQVWDPMAHLVLDTRAAEVDDAALEWLVSLAASVGAALLRAGYELGLSDCAGTRVQLSQHAGRDLVRTWQRALIDIASCPAATLDAALAPVATTGAMDDRLAVVLLGRLGPAEVAALADLGTRWVPGHVLYLPRDTAAEARAVRSLAELGWTAAAVPTGEDPAAAWASVSAARVGSPA